MASGGQNEHESMDYETSRSYVQNQLVTRTDAHGVSCTTYAAAQVHSAAEMPEWIFYNQEAELVKFYGQFKIKSLLAFKQITVTESDNSLTITCVDPFYVDYVEKNVKEIGEIFSSLNMIKVDLPPPFYEKIVQYLQDRYRYSVSVYCKYFRSTSSVKIFTLYKDDLKFALDMLKDEIEYQQKKRKENHIGFDVNVVTQKYLDHSSQPYTGGTTDRNASVYPQHSIRHQQDSHSGTKYSSSTAPSHKTKTSKPYSPSFETEGIKVFVYKESIINVDVDVIVNAANEDLQHRGGVAKAIADAAGYRMITESNDIREKWGKVRTGDNEVTHAGGLPYIYVIHAVGPYWDQYSDRETCLEVLSDTVEGVLKRASWKLKVRSVAIPPISSGIFGVPKEMCACMYIRGIVKFSKKNSGTTLKEIHLVDVNQDMVDLIKHTIVTWKTKQSLEPKDVLRKNNPASTSSADNSNRKFSMSDRPATAESLGGKKSYSAVVSGKDHSQSRTSHNKWTSLQTETIPGVSSSVHCYEVDDGLFTVKIYTGSIARVPRMSAILCSADLSLSGTGPLQSAILNAGGQMYRDNFMEMQSRFGLRAQNGQVYSCKGGRLPVDYVVHVVIPILAKTFDTDLKQHKDYMKGAFHKTNKWNMKSIAMPLIGSGFVEGNKQDLWKLCNTLFLAVSEFIQEEGPKSLREIYFVNKNTVVTQGLIEVFDKHSTKSAKPPVRRSLSGDTGHDFDTPSTGKQSHNEVGQGAKSKFGSESFQSHKTHLNSDHNKRFSKSMHLRSSTKEKDLDFDLQNLNLQQNEGHAQQKVRKHKSLYNRRTKEKFSWDEQSEIQDQKKSSFNSRGKIGIFTDESSEEEEDKQNKETKIINSTICATCAKQLDKDNRTCLPCGHAYCDIPCFIPMSCNRTCFLCSKNITSSAAESRNITNQDKGAVGGDNSDDTCVICMDTIKKGHSKILKCGHKFCDDCIMLSLKHKPVCPTCGAILGELEGDQPDDGKMTVKYDKYRSLRGYEGCGTIEIFYSFKDGIQQENHPEPGKPYKGTERRAFLPMNKEGKKVLNLLKIAFERKLTFTIGSSRTTGEENVVTWNDIHHKTRRDTGAARFGYPDPTYLTRVQDELAAKGITEDCL